VPIRFAFYLASLKFSPALVAKFAISVFCRSIE